MGTKKRTPVTRPSPRKKPSAKARTKAPAPEVPAAPEAPATGFESKVLDSLLSVVKKIRRSLSS